MKKPDLTKSMQSRGAFKVPEGYFENLAERVMSQIPREEASQPERVVKVSFWKTELYAKLKPYIYMAAMFGGLYFGIWVFKYQKSLLAEKGVVAQTSPGSPADPIDATVDEETKEYFNDVCDYTMADSHEIMACLDYGE